MEKPLPFIIQNNDKLELYENVIKIIEKSINPRLLLFYGATRQGKSTTLNQIIRGNIDSWKYINRQPFETQTSQRSLTVGCNIFGPIKCSEIKKRHNLKTKLEEDFDIFFCDTEGLFSLNGQSRVLIPGILTLLQVCTLSVIMINSVADVNTISQISAEIQFSKLLQQINHDLKSPLVAIYVSEFQVDTLKYNDYDTCIDLYTEEAKNASDLIFENINEKYPNLNIRKNDFKVIAGGPYQKNNDKEPSHDDVNAMLYWNSINEIAKQFIIHSNKTQNYNVQKLISLIRIVFDIFKDFKDLPKDIDIKGVLIKYIKDSFKEFSSSQFETINEEIKKDLKNNYDKYYQMLIDRNTANEKLNLCIEKEKYEIYKALIPEEIRNFMENAYLKLINSIVFQFEEEFKIKNVIITSKDYIMNHIKHIIEEINKANFQEDINMEIVNNYIKIWNLVEKENEGLFKFFKEKKPTNLENLKKNFNNSIEKIIKDLISKKLIWKKFFEDRKADIKVEINTQYIELFRKVQHQEDFAKLIKSHEILSDELFEKYNKQYFKNLCEEKKNEIKKWIKQECETEYNKLKNDNLRKEKWANISKDFKSRVTEKINNYINSIFNGKYFRNEIEPNLGREDIIYNIIKDLNKNKEVSQEKQQEIKNIMKNAIHYAVNSFNKKREELPLFEEVLLKKEQYCNKIADDKIKELLSRFTYAEDKIIFYDDNFYTLLKQNKEINLNIPQNNMEFDYMIRKVSQNKSNEYNNILVPKKPKWTDIKEKIRIKIDELCEKFIKQIIGNKSFKEEIKYDIKILDKQIESLNLFNGINQNKHNEIKNLINNRKEETKLKILLETNSLMDWSIIKELKINEGKEIMINKLDSNLRTKNLNLNEIKKILIDEVKNYPRFGSEFRNKKELYNKIFEELEKKAEEIAKNYINKKKIEDEKNKQKEKELEDLLTCAELEAQQRMKEYENKLRQFDNDSKNKIQNLVNEINQLKQQNRQPPPPPPQPQPQPQPPCFQRPNYNGGSIVDALKSIGANSSYNYRCSIAARNGIGGYAGRPHENVHMLNLLKQGRLLIP